MTIHWGEMKGFHETINIAFILYCYLPIKNCANTYIKIISFDIIIKVLAL